MCTLEKVRTEMSLHVLAYNQHGLRPVPARGRPPARRAWPRAPGAVPPLIKHRPASAPAVAGSETAEVSIGLLERRLADALAANVARDAPPPFGLLQVAEALGLGPLHPEAISPSVLVE